MMTSDELEQYIRQGIPLSAEMGFRVLELSSNSIQVLGGEQENINVHGTAFAGALYSVCTLAAWGLVTSRLPQDASLVLAEGSIRYRKPVVGNIVADCEVSDREMVDFLNALNRRGRARLVATVLVPCNGETAAEFTGTVYASIKKYALNQS
jgi:thioesterase domain-containing protein